jgi:colanic acid/amylovoran biosynthesis glycosyltransferase
MKIAYILTTFPCRSETFAASEIQNLRKLGFDITVFAAAGQYPNFSSPPDSAVKYRPPLFSMRSFFSVVYLLFRHPLWNIKLSRLLLKLILLNPQEAKVAAANIHTIAFFARVIDKKSISHIHAYFLNWPCCITMALAAVTGRTFSIAAHARDLFVERGEIKLKASHARFIVTCTQYGMDYLKRRLPESLHNKLHLNYHGIDIKHSNFGDSRKTGNSDGYRLAAVGRLVPKKGFDYLIKAFSFVHLSFPNCTLSIAGDGSEYGKLSALVCKMNLETSVKFLGWLDHDSTMQLIRSSTILVVPSIIAADGDRDGIPNVIIEAFVNGTPVVAGRLPATAEAIEHCQNGLLADSCDETELADAIENLLSDKDLRSQLSQKAYETAVNRFDAAKNAGCLAKLFMEVN